MLQTTTNKSPGFTKHSEHVIALEQNAGTQRAVLNGIEIAVSDNAITMVESRYSPVIYFPVEDVKLDLATVSDHTTYCPFKGTATYLGFGGIENIAWKYDTPYDEMLAIKGYIAFYADKLDSVS